MASTLRRLAGDHASLHNSGLPPNYLFPPSSSSSSSSAFPDDLTQLTILLAGPQWTPYSQGLWKLHIRLPDDYPQSPPKVSFRTRIWHPNVEESTGAVCVDTLKKDWEATLTLRDVLVTISCLLIQPNPDSALNSAAGALLQDDYEAFTRQARLMTSIHAPIPRELKDAVTEAKRRGEDPDTTVTQEEQDNDDNKTRSSALSRCSKKTTTSSVVMKKNPHPASLATQDASNAIERLDIRVKSPQHNYPLHRPIQPLPCPDSDVVEDNNDDDEENPTTASKENDPSLSPFPVVLPPPSPRKNNNSVLGKRPLSVLSVPSEPELVLVDTRSDEDGFDGLSASERNIVANLPHQQKQNPKQDGNINLKEPPVQGVQLHNKSSKLSSDWTWATNAACPVEGLDKSVNGEILSPISSERKFNTATDDRGMEMNENESNNNGNGKGNLTTSTIASDDPFTTAANYNNITPPNDNDNDTLGRVSNPPLPSSLSSESATHPIRKASSSSSAPSKQQKPKPRIGVRRL